jgi:Ca2+-binding EF-hand superfamily protein
LQAHLGGPEDAVMPTDKQRQELEDKFTTLIKSRFDGDGRAAFAHYDTDGDGKINKDELKAMLSEAGIGSGLTRWAWADGILDELDKSGDRLISWDEFAAATEGIA